MQKRNRLHQLKSKKLWRDGITVGLAIFGGVSAITGATFGSIKDLTDNLWISVLVTIGALIVSYVVAIVWKWWQVKDSISLKIRGIKVTIRQGDIFKEDGLKVIGVDSTFSTSEDDQVISHSSLHGKLIRQLSDNCEIKAFRDSIDADTREMSLGSIKQYNDYLLMVMTTLDNNNEAHTCNQKYESTLRTMWMEIGRVYSGRPIVLPLLGDGIIRFDGVSEKPSPYALLKCMLCTLKTSSVQLKAPVTIVIYDRINDINLYDLKGV